MPTLVINCRVVLIYSIRALDLSRRNSLRRNHILQNKFMYKVNWPFLHKKQDLHKTNLGDNQTFYQVNVESCMRDFSFHLAFSFTFMNLRQQKWRKCFQKWSQSWKFNKGIINISLNKDLTKILQQVLCTDGTFRRWSWSDTPVFLRKLAAG